MIGALTRLDEQPSYGLLTPSKQSSPAVSRRKYRRTNTTTTTNGKSAMGGIQRAEEQNALGTLTLLSPTYAYVNKE